MRTLLVPPRTDTTALSTRLMASGSAQREALTRLNPHTPLDRLAAGTLLLVPEGVEADDSSSITGEAFAELSQQLLEGLSQACQAAEQGHAQRLEEGKAVLEALDSEALKTATRTDPELAAQISRGRQVLEQDTKTTPDALAALARMQEQVKSDLEALGKLVDR